MTKFQAERLVKKAQKYPHQLTDSEVLFLNSALEMFAEQKKRNPESKEPN